MALKGSMTCGWCSSGLGIVDGFVTSVTTGLATCGFRTSDHCRVGRGLEVCREVMVVLGESQATDTLMSLGMLRLCVRKVDL